MKHAAPAASWSALSLSIGLGALLNAGWLLLGLRRLGVYQPAAGWWGFGTRVVVASGPLGGALFAAAHHIDWIGLRVHPGQRSLLLAGVLAGVAVLYFAALQLSGLNLRQFARRVG